MYVYLIFVVSDTFCIQTAWEASAFTLMVDVTSLRPESANRRPATASVLEELI